jgi:hypothetical protein
MMGVHCNGRHTLPYCSFIPYYLSDPFLCVPGAQQILTEYLRKRGEIDKNQRRTTNESSESAVGPLSGFWC